MGYTVPTKIRVDLSQFGTDGAGAPFFAEIQNLNSAPYAKKMKYLSTVTGVFSGIDPERVKNNDMSGVKIDAEKAVELAKSIQGMIIAWNVIDFDGNPVKIDDVAAFDKIPGFVTEEIMKQMNQKIQADAEKQKN